MKFQKKSSLIGLIGLLGSSFLVSACTGAGDKDVVITEEDPTPGLVGPGGKGPPAMVQPEDITPDGAMSQVEGDEDPVADLPYTPGAEEGVRIDRPNLTPEAEVIEPGGPRLREEVAGQQRPGQVTGEVPTQQPPAEPGFGVDSRQVAEVQAELRQLGFYDGPIDGALGRQTQQALREFQMAQGIQVTGQINQNTLAALGQA